MPYDTGMNWGVTEDVLTRCLVMPQGTAGCKQARRPARSFGIEGRFHGLVERNRRGEMIMILDSCHSGAVPGTGFRLGPLGDPSFGQLSYDKQMQILSASQAAQTAHGEWITGGEGRTLLAQALEKTASGASTTPDVGR